MVTERIKKAINDFEQMGEELAGSGRRFHEDLVNANSYLIDRIEEESRNLEKAKNIPYQARREIYGKLKSARDQSGSLMKLLKSYAMKEEELEKIQGELGYVNNTDAIQKNKKEDFIKGLYQKKEVVEKIKSDYGRTMTQVADYISKTLNEVDSDLSHYRKKGEHTGTKAEKAVALSICGAFGATLLYALSNVRPENVSVGYFVGGASSPVIWVMLSAVIIFLLFFLGHHKLK